MTVKIYLRSIVKHGKKHLAMFDSKREGDIDKLTTDVWPGDKIVWNLDCCSGIKSITKIYPKEGKGKIFQNDPKKLLFGKGFELHVPKFELDKEVIEAYAIEYILFDKTKVIIDPYIRIPPPRIPG
jgi:hypothetical protein